MTVLPRGRGRPRVEDPKSTVATRLPTRHHDRLVSIARRNDVSVAAVVRRAVFLFLKDDSTGWQR